MKLDIPKLAAAAGLEPVDGRDAWTITPEQIATIVVSVAAHCATYCRDEAAMRREGGLTFPLERNPPYIRGQVRGATACAVRIEEEFGIAKHGGPNG